MAEEMFKKVGDAYQILTHINMHPPPLMTCMHPPPTQMAEEMFKKVGDAYQILSDPQKRALYDKYGEDAFKEGAQVRGFRV